MHPVEGPGAWERARARIEELADATGTTVRALAIGALCLGAVLGAGWWLTRTAPSPVESVLPVVDVAAVTTTTAAPGPVVVHVSGAVATPGVQRLGPGARVVDAVDAAGGLTGEADVDRINLAAELADGDHVHVPRVGEAVPSTTSGAPGAAGGGLVDLNLATPEELESLPGVGPATAAAIVDHRERHGPFAAVDGLLDVRGIGEAKLAALRDLVRV